MQYSRPHHRRKDPTFSANLPQMPGVCEGSEQELGIELVLAKEVFDCVGIIMVSKYFCKIFLRVTPAKS